MISGMVGAAIAIVLLSYVSRRAAAVDTGGRLNHGLLLKSFAWVMTLAVLGLTYVMLFVDHNGQYVPLAFLILGFGAGAVYMMGDVYRTRGTFDSNGIEFESLWTGKKTQKWSDLVEVSYNEQMYWYVLLFADGTKIRVSNQLQGHGRLLDHIQSLGKQIPGRPVS